MTEDRTKLHGVIPMLQVNSVRETIDFYTGALGFEVTSTYPEDGEPGWCMLKRDDANVMFSEHAEYDHDEGHDHDHDHDEAHDHDHDHDDEDHGVAAVHDGPALLLP